MSNPTLDAIKERQKRNDEILVADENIARNNWRREYGKMTGFTKAWKTKHVPKAAKVPRSSNQMSRPATLDPKGTERIAEPDARSLVRLKEGWSVLTYRINGVNCSIVGQTKPEPKQFATNRLLQMIMEEIK